MNSFYAIAMLLAIAYVAAVSHSNAAEIVVPLEYTAEELQEYTNTIYDMGWDDAMKKVVELCSSKETETLMLIGDGYSVTIECKTVGQGL